MSRLGRAGWRVAGGVALLFAIVVSGSSGRGALAQDRTAQSMDFVRERVRADKKAFIAKNLELTEPEAKAFWPVYDEFQTDLLKIEERGVKIIGDYTTAYPHVSDDAARRLLDDFLAAETDQLKVRQAFLSRFRGALPDKKVLRYYQLEYKIHAITVYELATKIPFMK